MERAPSREPEAVEAEITRQHQALRARVERSGLYTHEVEEFSVAHQAYRQLAARFRVADDLGSLTTAESRNIVRKVRMGDGALAVLKVIGNTREAGEGEVLEAWWSRGLPCAEPLAWGYERVSLAGRPRTATFLVTRFIEPKRSGSDGGPSRPEDLTARLVGFMRQFHFAGVAVTTSRTWEDRLNGHLRWTLPLIRRHGLPEPRQWKAKLRRVSQDGQAIVHGDPAGRNVLVTDSGFVLLDPPGALRAMREADIGQICSQVGGTDNVDLLIDVACDTDPTLLPDAVACFAGLNFLTWAGYFLAGHDHPDVASAGPSAPGDPTAADHARRYLTTADTLLSRFLLDEA
jgi:hypothetical protein